MHYRLEELTADTEWTDDKLEEVIKALFKTFQDSIVGRQLLIRVDNRLVYHTSLSLQTKYKVFSERIAVLTGAGATRALTNNKEDADWNGLVQRLVFELEADKKLAEDTKRAIKNVVDQDTHSAAHHLVEQVGKDQVNPYLEHYMRDIHRNVQQDAPFARVLRNIQCPIITLNYDEAIEDACGRHVKKVRADETQIPLKKENVVHLHGVSEGTHLILSQDSYINSATPTSQLMKRLTEEGYMFVLFGVGAALGDPDLKPWLHSEGCKRVVASSSLCTRSPQRPVTHIVLGSQAETQQVNQANANGRLQTFSLVGTPREDRPNILQSILTEPLHMRIRVKE
jgi:hypothetical protein